VTVNELARAAGIPAGRVRYYARCGLLPAGRDPDNDYRRFAPQALVRLRFIVAARALRFALADVARLLGEADAGRSPCPSVRELLDRRLADIAARRRALAHEQTRLEALRRRWRVEPDGRPDPRSLCPLLDSVPAEVLAAAGDDRGAGSEGRPVLVRAAGRRRDHRPAEPGSCGRDDGVRR
jgi:DNA-binding transcriptional MerR regulator